MQAISGLRLHLLGRLTVSSSRAPDQPLSISSRKGCALLAYLAMQPAPTQRREQLATLLWGDRFDKQARQSLRQSILALRQQLEPVAPGLLVLDGELVGLDTALFATDAHEFAALAEEGGDPERALDLYRGEFLAGFNLDVEPFDDWVRGERSRFAAIAARLLELQAQQFDKRGDGEQVLRACERLLAIDPLREDWQRLALTLTARHRGRDAALARAKALVALLRKELDADPEPGTAALINDIKRGDLKRKYDPEPGAGTASADVQEDVHDERAEQKPPDRLGDLGIEEPQQGLSPRLERRPLTVLACDLTAPAALTGGLDPEDLMEMIGECRSRLVDAVSKHGGFVAQFLADGLVAYFGYPEAHEDDAERAVRAGLDTIEAVRQIESVRSHHIEARVGIATGVVVVADLMDKGTTTVGDAPCLASRLQASAQPGAVLISANTHRQTGGLFEYRSMGRPELRGVPDGLRVFEVLGESAFAGRFEALRTDRTALVGREEEIEVLLRRWKQAKEREGSVVLLSGEPGIGKSRIVHALKEQLQGEPHFSLSYFCSPHHENSALFPVIRQLERDAGFERGDAPEIMLDKLKAVLGLSSKDLRGDAALLADLLSIPTNDPRHDLSPQKRKAKTLDAFLAQLVRMVDRLPVLLIVEDAHWIDPTSLELLERVVDRIQRLPVLAIVSARPEFRSPWSSRPHVTTRLLNRLNHSESQTIVQQVAGGKTIPSEVVYHIVDRTDGIPLFLEELTKAVLESGALGGKGERLVLTAPLASLAIPATLHASLLARLDRLPAAKKVATAGAAIGREFSHELITAVSDESEADLSDALQQLVRAELLHQRGTPPNAVYIFKHPLIRDAAYSTLMRPARQELHARIASVIELSFQETAKAEPEFLAHHFAEAGLIGRAVDYRLKAGLRATHRSDVVEAVAQLHMARGLLPNLPAGPERDRQEMACQVALAGVLAGSGGYTAPEMGQTLARARKLCEGTGDGSRLFPVLYLQRLFHLIRAELDRARDIGEEMLQLAGQWGDSTVQLPGHNHFGQVAYFQGEFILACTHLEKALALYKPEQHHNLTFLYGQNPRVVALSYQSWVLFVLGYPEQALQTGAEATSYSRELAHANSVAFARNFSSWLYHLLRDRSATLRYSDAQILSCRELGLFYWLAQAHVLHGWAVAVGGEPEAAIAELTQGIAAYRATGAELQVPVHLGLQAATLREMGRPVVPALALLSDALARVDRTGERQFEAELHRIKGECLLSLPTPDQEQAEASFIRALEVARGQSAKMWELRAASCLTRLWQSQGKVAEARDLLAPVYGWFTEGFDTADLRDASTVLDTLGG